MSSTGWGGPSPTRWPSRPRRPHWPGCGARPGGLTAPSISSILRTVPIGDLVFANVIDATQRAAQGDMGDSVVYVRSLPGRALPFDVLRAWKAPTGYVTEEIELVTPRGMV